MWWRRRSTAANAQRHLERFVVSGWLFTHACAHRAEFPGRRRRHLSRRSWPSGVLTVDGAHTGAAVARALVYDNGTKATCAATVQDASHMSGMLAYEGGSS